MPTLTLTIPGEPKLSKIIAAWLRRHPVDIDDDTGLPIIDPNTGLPYTEVNWVINEAENLLIKETKEGRRMIRLDEGRDAFRDEKSDFDDSFDIT